MGKRVEIILPRLDPDMEYGVVMKWIKKKGERVAKGEPIFTIETEKVTVDIESPVSGVIVDILVSAGTKVPVGAVVAIVEGDEVG